MRNGRPGGANGVASRAARARAERLWSETVAVPCAPSDDNGGSKDPRRPLNGAPTESSLPAGPATRKLRALWISAFHLGLITGLLGRRAGRVDSPPEEPRRGDLPERRRPRPRHPGAGSLARARRRRGLAAAPLPRPERARAGDPPPPRAGAGGAVAHPLPPGPGADREPRRARRLRRPPRGPRPRRLPHRAERRPGRRPDPPPRQVHPPSGREP